MRERMIEIASKALLQDYGKTSSLAVKVAVDALIEAGAVMPKFKIRQEVWAIVECMGGENVHVIHDNDYINGTGATECVWENECNFEDCENCGKQIFKTVVENIHIDRFEKISYFLKGIYEEIGIYATEAEALEALEGKK